MTQRIKPYPRPRQMVKGYAYKKPITFDLQYGWLSSGQFPAECIAECSASGSVDDAVEYWRKKLEFAAALAPVRPIVERYLGEYGSWDDLDTADIDVLADRVLWTACCDIREQGEWAGLVH